MLHMIPFNLFENKIIIFVINTTQYELINKSGFVKTSTQIICTIYNVKLYLLMVN